MIKDCGYFGDTNFRQEIYIQTKRNRSILWEVKAQLVCLFVFLFVGGGGGGG